MAKKRDKLGIVYDILISIKEKNGKIRQTNIMYKSNLSFQSLHEYLDELIKKNFLVEHKDKKDVKTFSITNEGLNFLSKYSEIKDFMDTFGIESGPESA